MALSPLEQPADALRSVALRLDYMIGQITPEEFYWQDSNYDRDSALGRELLFLIANNDWVRATSEIVDITRSDTISTNIDIDVDLDRITHEAYRGRTGQIWLPVVVLPPLRQRLPDSDPLSTLTVTDPTGSPLMTLSHADVRHRIAAALTEIILNAAVTHQGDIGADGDASLSVTRDHRLLLSAAIYRLLRSEHVPADVLRGDVPARRPGHEPLPRIDRMRNQLGALLAPYSALLADPADAGNDASGARQLTVRAIRVLRAFAESAVVVVAADRDRTPTVLTVTLPGRALHMESASWADVRGPQGGTGRRWSRPGAWRSLRPGNWVLPRATLRLDLLLASAEADRQVRVNLPDGVSPDPSLPLASRAGLEIICALPLAVSQLGSLTRQLVAAGQRWPATLAQCLAELAAAKADGAWAALRDHRAGPGQREPAAAGGDQPAGTAGFRAKIDQLGTVLRDIAADGSQPGAWDRLDTAWAAGAWLHPRMWRRTSTDMVSPGVVAARARLVEDVVQRAAPTRATMGVHLAVTDARYFSAAAMSGWMSALLMSVVLGFFAAQSALHVAGGHVSAEVLALVLTLFCAVQAGRIERPDRSTMRGLLVPAGNPLIVASILPPVVLAVALAFSQSTAWALTWSAACIAGQSLLLFLQWLLLSRALSRGLGPDAAIRGDSGLVFYTDAPDYVHSEVLHSGWWRRTTAEALMIGRPAYGYVVWQHSSRHTLRSLLHGGRPAGEPPTGGAGLELGVSALEQPANVLALQRSGAGSQVMTFAVFRDEPKADWDCEPEDIVRVDLYPGPLAPADDATGWIGVFLGIRSGTGLPVGGHPITRVLERASVYGLVVREVQLPVPPPDGAYADLRWARLQISLRPDDLRQLVPFLHDMQHLADSTPRDHPFVIVGVQTRTEGGVPRLLNPRPAAAVTRHGRPALVLASDLDVVASATRQRPSVFPDPSGKTWRVMAVCADWRNGIECQVLASLDGGLTLAGLTAATLHGKAVLLLLCHRADGPGGAGQPLLARPHSARPGEPVLYFDRWQRGTELGAAPHCPLLRVHMRAPDRPGATLHALESLRQALHDVAGESAPASRDWNVWYARAVVTDGNIVQIQLTIMLPAHTPDGHAPGDHVTGWGPAEFARIEQRTLELLTQNLAAARQAERGGQIPAGALPDTVIRVGLVSVPEPWPRSAHASHGSPAEQ